jgi:hypothetical protein
MFSFRARSAGRHATIREALVQSGLAKAGDFTRVALLENHGQYAGRRVTFFRAFEPGHQDLLLGSGHVEPDGLVVVNNVRAAQENAPAREPADRAHHADDERLVFWDAAVARSSEATLSGPAATWLHAQSNSEDQR